MDVLFWDESLYLSRGLSMFDHIPKDWGPSYSLWYKLLSYFISDRVELYYFNFKLTTILISIAFFCCCRLVAFNGFWLLYLLCFSFKFYQYAIVASRFALLYNCNHHRYNYCEIFPIQRFKISHL